MASSTITTPMANTTEESFQDASNFHLYIGVAIFSSVFLFIITGPTLVFNGMTLFAIHRDPLKCFRNPLTMFMTGVLVADFISGLIVYPFFGAVYVHELRVGQSDATNEVYHIAVEVLTATVIISFLTLLGLAISQLIAVNSPLRYDRWVTVRGVKTGLICIWVYAAVFTTIPHFFADQKWIGYFFLFFLIFHCTVVTVALVILYIVTYLVFAARAARQLDEEENKQVSKEFFKGTCILALVQILLMWPVGIILYIETFLQAADVETEVRVEVARLISDDLLFTKFLLDPIILVWRVPKYRQAMKMVFPRCFGAGQDSGTKSRVSYSRSNVKVSKEDHENSIEDVDVEVM